MADHSHEPQDLDTRTSAQSALDELGQAANHAAAQHVFDEYRSRRAQNSLRAQDADLDLFASYLYEMGVRLSSHPGKSPGAWQGITWGLITGFVHWMLNSGYSIASINRRLSTVKKYAGLAFQAGAIDATEHALIRQVKGYTHKEGQHIDEKREDTGVETRVGSKKADPVRITFEQARQLKAGNQDTPQGLRDALLMCLLLDHGLRCGEVARLEVQHIDLKHGELRFYRPKVDVEQTHRLTDDTLQAVQAWFDSGAAPPAGKLLRRSLKGGKLGAAGMSERAINRRVADLGNIIGIDGLSPHDCRHYWATRAARQGTDPFALQEAGGWKSLAMPRQYIEAASIANDGVVLD